MSAGTPSLAAGRGRDGHRDIIVVGASTGGVAALGELVAALPADLPAAVFVVLHQGDTSRSYLSSILSGRGPLPATLAVHGEVIRHGRIYLAPPDNHLLVRQGHVDVVRGPRESGHRPAVNPLFRTAADAYGPRVIGVVLTGALDCGTAGLHEIKTRGGIGVAEDPRTAACPDMPASAIEARLVDHVVHGTAVGSLLVRLVAEPIEAAVSTSMAAQLATALSFITCPLCNGTLSERSVAPSHETVEVACHVGHTFGMHGLYAAQADHLESALWGAVRALEESTFLTRRLMQSASGEMLSRFDEKARTMTQHAETLRAMILAGQLISRRDVAREP